MKKITLLVLAIVAAQISFSQSTSPSPYCDGSFDDAQGLDVDDQINAVVFGDLSNVSNARQASPRYVFYDNLPVKNFTKGSTYPLSVKFDVHGGAGYGVWIDFNHNNTFEATEKVLGTTSQDFMTMDNNVEYNGTVMIPTTATVGQTRMRVRIVEDDNYIGTNGADILPCNASSSNADVMDWGETEDYTINIVASGNVGLSEINNNDVVKLSPNPCNGIFNLESSVNITNVTVYSILGEKVYSRNNDFSTKTIDLSNQPKGVYLVKIQTFNNATITKRIVVK